MAVLNRRLAEEFMVVRPGVLVQVEGEGTATGLVALIEGRADIWAASRPPTAAEIQLLFEHFETLGQAAVVARDALSVYLNPGNPVRSLTTEQVRRIFSGEVEDWSEVGGRPAPIRVTIRPPTSGTHRFFRDHVLHGAEFSDRAEVIAHTADIAAAVAVDLDAIGFGGVAYARDVRHCMVEGQAPAAPGTRYESGYPLSRNLYLVTAAPPTGQVKAFVDWSLSAAGQRVVAEVGYLPAWLGAYESEPAEG